MVSWASDGLIVGYDPVTRRLKDGLYHFASAGSVDLNGVTRLSYPMGAGLNSTTYPNRLKASARMTFTAGDFLANPGKKLSMGMLVIDAAHFAPGQIPTPAEILAKGSANYAIYGADRFVTSAQTRTFNMASAYEGLGVNTKWWVLLLPMVFTAPNIFTPTMAGINVNTVGRAVSLWSGRTPDKPTITSPVDGYVALPGADFAFAIEPDDPDAVSPPDDSDRYNMDLIGVQVQYAPAPTIDNPNPEWQDLPYDVDAPGIGPWRLSAWHIKGSRDIHGLAGLPELNALINNLGFPVVAGAGDSVDDYQPGKGALPAGEWQLRCRTFDFGHPYPNDGTSTTAPGPLGINPATTQLNRPTKDSYPATNTSPWSDSIRVTVPAQVLPPLPLTPKDNLAVPEGQSVTMKWKYRNTHVPPLGQYRRTVQIRPVSGNNEWSTVFEGETASTFVDLPPTLTQTPVLPAELLADGGFEGGGLDGWGPGTTPNLTFTNVSSAPDAHSGSRYLRIVNSAPIDGFGTRAKHEFTPAAEYETFVFKYWVQCDFDAVPTETSLTLLWLDSLGNPIVPPDPFNSPYVVLASADLVSGWNYGETPVLKRPPDGVTIQIDLSCAIVGDFYNNPTEMRLDDASVMAYGPALDDFTMSATTQYEWRVKAMDTDGEESNYSIPARFWVVPAGASGDVRPIPSETVDGATLGCGNNRVFVYRRGGKERVGEIKNMSHVDWSRVRDEISTAKVEVSGWDVDCGNLLAKLQTWAYELVIIRDNGYSKDRVWEGPITLLTFETDKVTIHAKDVMGYAYRRIIKQRMSDAGTGNGTTVVDRARRVLQNAFAPDDPNVLAYLQVLAREDDAMQYRTTPAYSRTAYEEVDDMAANSGLDYTCVGRSILLWGTKHRIGTLPEFRDKDLGSSPIVSEYGMSMSNRYAVSDGNGVYGEAERLVDGTDPIYGLVEMLSSTWATDSENETGTYTQEGLETVRESFREFSERSIADRYPPPVVVRVPDNTSVNPDTVISIQHLVPGVVIPLRSTGTLRSVRASQKLDSVKVVQEGSTETISITLSPFSRDDATMTEGEE